MLESLVHSIESAGLPALVLVMFLENLFPPIPSEVVIPFAGYMASIGSFHFIGVVLSSVLGSVLGALALYWIGTFITEAILVSWVEKYGKWFLLRPSDVRKSGAWFRKYGHWAVLIGRIIPGIRSLISLPAGIERMPLGPFIAYTSLGSGVWTILLAGSGYALGSRYADVEALMKPFAIAMLTFVLVLIVGYVVYRYFVKNDRP